MNTKIAFEFTEEMMIIALLANGWTDGWRSGHWFRPGQTATGSSGYSLREAFGRILWEKDLVGKDYNEHWHTARN